MCDIVDFVFESTQSFIRFKRLQDQGQILPSSSFNISENSIHENSKTTSQTANVIKYAQINELWSVLLLIQRQEHMISLIFKLQKNIEIFRIHTNFAKTYLISKFTKDNLFPLQQHLNPLTGEIYLSISFLIANFQQSETIQQIQFATKISSFKKGIINYWQKIIAMTEGDFRVGENFINNEKVSEIKALALNSQRENQSANVYNFKTYLKNSPKESKTQSEMQKFLLVRKKQRKESEDFPYRKCLIQVFKNKKGYQQQSFRIATSFSNFQTLNVDTKDKEIVFSRIGSLQKEQIFKFEDMKFGKLFLNSVSCGKKTLQMLLKNLSYLGQNTQHNYLNYYFLVRDANRQQLLKMALKKLPLKEFIQKNANCLSFQKKLSIFLNLFYVLLEFWGRYNTFPGFFDINDFSITKNHIIKFESVDKWRKLDQDENEFISDEKRAFYRAEMMLRAQQILKQMFFNTNLIQTKYQRVRKSSIKVRIDEDQQGQKVKASQMINQLHFYGVKEILSPVLYCFQKYEMELIKSDSQQQQLQKEEFNFQQMRNTKKGNLDLVFGTLSKSLELINSML